MKGSYNLEVGVTYKDLTIKDIIKFLKCLEADPDGLSIRIIKQKDQYGEVDQKYVLRVKSLIGGLDKKDVKAARKKCLDRIERMRKF